MLSACLKSLPGLPVVGSADALGFGVRGVLVSVEMIVPEDRGGALTTGICITHMHIHNAEMRHSADYLQ